MTFKSKKNGALEPSGARHLEDNIDAIFDEEAPPPRKQNGQFSERIVTAYRPKK